MKKDYAKSTTVTLTSFEATIATALENARNITELSAKAVNAFWTIQKEIAVQPEFAELDALRKAREEAEQKLSSACKKHETASRVLEELQDKNWLVRLVKHDELTCAETALATAEEAVAKAQKAYAEAQKAYTARYECLQREHDLKIERLKERRDIMRQQLKQRIVALIDATPQEAPTATNEEVSLEEAARNSIRDEFLKRELFKELAVRAVLKEFASGARRILVEQSVLTELFRGTGYKLDMSLHCFHSESVAAEWLANQVQNRIGTSVLRVTAEMVDSQSYGKAYINFSYAS